MSSEPWPGPSPGGTASSVPTADADLTARARIRDAAIACFADAGVAGTSVRTIARTAGVSPGLVIHHFGSKDALRVACDRHVATIVREGKHAAVSAGTGFDPVAALRQVDDGPPVLRYLARTLVDGSPQVAELIDEMVDDAAGYLAAGVERGVLKPAEDPRGRAAVLVLWSLGSLVLHEHIARLTGADLIADPTRAQGWTLPAMEILAKGVLTDEVYAHYREAFTSQEG